MSALISHGSVGSSSFLELPAGNASIVENETPTQFVVVVVAVAGCNPSCCEISESIINFLFLISGFVIFEF